MKVLYLTPGCYDKGGISRYSRYQISALREIYGDKNVVVFSLLGKESDSIEEHIDVQWSGTGVNRKSKLLFAFKTISKAASWRPDIIFCAHVNFSGLACMAAKLCGAKTVLNVYGLEVRMKLSSDAAWGLKKSDWIISDCHATADDLVNRHLKDASRITVIWDCIALQKFKPADSMDVARLAKYNIPDPADHFILLTLGRLSKPDAFYKGYDRLIKVFSEISPAHPSAQLVIAGRGNYREELEQMVKEHRLNGKVSFTGSIDEADLPLIYQSCDLFSLITEAGEGKGEGIPLTPLEALACGKPILVGDQDGSREAIVNNENGYVVNPKDLDRHKEIIEGYIQNQDLLQQHSANAVKIARSHFSYQIFKDKHVRFLNKFAK